MQTNKLLIHFTTLTINFPQLDMIMTTAYLPSFFNIFYCESPWFSYLCWSLRPFPKGSGGFLFNITTYIVNFANAMHYSSSLAHFDLLGRYWLPTVFVTLPQPTRLHINLMKTGCRNSIFCIRNMVLFWLCGMSELVGEKPTKV